MTQRCITRRSFNSLLGMTAAGAALSKYLTPTVAYAVPGANGPSTIEIYIKIFLNGGLDGLYVVPPKDQTMFNALRVQRPTLMNSPFLNSPAQHVLDLGQSFGLHWHLGPQCPVRDPATYNISTMSALGLKSIYELITQGDGKVLPRIGFPTPNLNHTTAVDPWNIGATNIDRGSALHWEARLMQQGGYSWNQMWLLGFPGGMIPFRPAAGQTAPVATRFLSQVSRFTVDDWSGWHQGWELGGNAEVSASQSVIERIMQLPDPTNAPIALSKYKSKMRDTLATIDSVTPIINTTIPNYFSNYFYPDNFDVSMGDIAKIIYHYRVTQARQSKLLFHLGYNGFDTHGQLGSTQDDALIPRMQALNHSIGALHKFLLANNLWNKTVIQIVSEFGRGVIQDPLGTPHGHASNLFILGGAVNSSGGSIVGGSTLLPTINDLATPVVNGGSTILTSALDPRDVMWEVVQGLGENPSTTFPGYSPQRVLNLFG